MAFELLDNRNRAIGIAAALGINGLLLVLLLSLSRDAAPPLLRGPGLAAFDIALPPPPPSPPQAKRAGASARSSHGSTKAPSPLNPPRSLPKPTQQQPALDQSSQSDSGAGSSPGNDAGQGGQGNGTGAGGAGSGDGAGVVPPVHIAGALKDADYARSGLPRGAAGTVLISFRVRSDGHVDRCDIVRSSGYSAIDSETCRLVERRFRFRPARNSGGNPIDFTLRTDFTWGPQ